MWTIDERDLRKLLYSALTIGAHYGVMRFKGEEGYEKFADTNLKELLEKAEEEGWLTRERYNPWNL